VVHCPASNLKLSSGFCPIQKLITAGVAVGLGTDSTASNNSLDMFYEMKTAAILAKAITNDPKSISAYQALQMATIQGAKALGIDNETGSLKPGKSADFIALNMSAIELLPMYDIISHLVYVVGRDRVTDVWVAGRRLLRNRELVTLNENRIVELCKKWQSAISEFRFQSRKEKASTPTK